MGASRGPDRDSEWFKTGWSITGKPTVGECHEIVATLWGHATTEQMVKARRRVIAWAEARGILRSGEARSSMSGPFEGLGNRPLQDRILNWCYYHSSFGEASRLSEQHPFIFPPYNSMYYLPPPRPRPPTTAEIIFKELAIFALLELLTWGLGEVVGAARLARGVVRVARIAGEASDAARLAELGRTALRADELAELLKLATSAEEAGELASLLKRVQQGGDLAADDLAKLLRYLDRASEAPPGTRIPDALETAATAGKRSRGTAPGKRSGGLPKPTVRDPKLKNAVDQLYRPGAKVGSGSTADAIRHELATGTRVGGKSHIQKGQDFVRHLEKWLRESPGATVSDRAAAKAMLDDLRAALGGN